MASSPSSPNPWVGALRLRTLPLAAAPIAAGGGIAAWSGSADLLVWVLCLATALLLQITSNLANDLGDGLKGTDAERLGPRRAVAAGDISIASMKRAVGVSAVLSALSGLVLMGLAWARVSPAIWWSLLAVGGLAVAAALAYTLGRRPYGYQGLGEVSVFLFFGLAGVMGTQALSSGRLHPASALVGAGIGLLAASVLGINNIRDREGDIRHGKLTLAVRLGDRNARRLHVVMVGLGALMVSATAIWAGAGDRFPAWLPAAALPLLIREGLRVASERNPRALNPRLGAMSMATAAAGILAGAGLALS